jgi:hypothetical protein
MTWTYSNPTASDKDKVRFLVGDTDTNGQLASDEEITWALTEGGVYVAASLVAKAIAMSFARKADFTVSQDLRVSYTKMAENYGALADKLENKASKLAPLPYAGGISVSDKETYEDDTDRVTPVFQKDNFMDAE